MGWNGGSSLLTSVWNSVREYIPPEDRVHLLTDLMYSFSQRDCDTLCECIYPEWPETKEAYENLYPDQGDEN